MKFEIPAVTVTDNTIENKCSSCGNCCTEFVPLTKREYKNIKDYLKVHPDITNEVHIEGDNMHVMCPFRDVKNKRCKIYEVRPFVCRRFICNLSNEQLMLNRNFGFSRAFYNNASFKSFVSFHVLFFNDIEWELTYLYTVLMATDAEDFKIKLKEMNPIIINQNLITLE